MAKLVLTLGQKVPNQSETAAVGKFVARISRGSEEFKKLIRNQTGAVGSADAVGAGAVIRRSSSQRQVLNLVLKIGGGTAFDQEFKVFDGGADFHLLRHDDDTWHRQRLAQAVACEFGDGIDIVRDKHAPVRPNRAGRGRPFCSTRSFARSGNRVAASAAVSRAGCADRSLRQSTA
jgi:hypothetical protein